MPLALKIARRKIANYPDEQANDVISDATFGLLSAARNYDPTNGTEFATFAIPRIVGAISDGRRQRDPLSREDRRLNGAVANERYRFAARHHRFPNDTELAERLGITTAELCAHQQAVTQRIHTVEFDAPTCDKSSPADTVGVDDPDYVHAESADALHRAIARLDGQARFVLGCYFFQGCTMLEVGEVLGITESRVWQIKARALAQLRDMPDIGEAIAA